VRADGSAPLKYQKTPEPKVSPEALTAAAASGEILTLKLRFKRPDADTSVLREYPLKSEGGRFNRASADFQFAAAVASFGMLLRGSQHRGDATFSGIEEIAAGAIGRDPGGYRAEFLDLVRRAKVLGR
jgi:Ca-activated chloride channel family protein